MLDAVWEQFLASQSSEKGDRSVVLSILKQLRPSSLTEDKIVLSCENQGVMYFIQGRLASIESEEVIAAATLGMKGLKQSKTAEFFMPPSVVSEFLSFFEDHAQQFLKDFLAEVTVKSPDLTKVQFPSSVFHRLVEDIRARSYKGLNIAEEEVKNMANLLNNQTTKLEKMEFEKKTGVVINKLRERYRQATRTGFLDSVSDLELIVLARELEGTLVSTDEGVIAWGRIFGVKEMDSVHFGHYLSR